MTALERIKEIEFECSGLNKEKLETYLKDPDVRFLLKAFKVMREIAILAHAKQLTIKKGGGTIEADFIDEEFEKKINL